MPAVTQANGFAAVSAADTAQVQQASAEAHLQRDIITHDDAHNPAEVEDIEAIAVPPVSTVHVQPTTGSQPSGRRSLENGLQTAGSSVLQDATDDCVVHNMHPRLTRLPSSDHEHVTDQRQSGHRLLANSQAPHKPLGKSLHKSRIWAQACQGKSQQRLMLMTALHRTAEKQLQRQHRHAGLQ